MNNPISIADAKAWTKKWQDNNSNHAKGFLIPVDDLLACMSQLGLTITKNSDGVYESDDANAKIRAYMVLFLNDTRTPTLLLREIVTDSTPTMTSKA